MKKSQTHLPVVFGLLALVSSVHGFFVPPDHGTPPTRIFLEDWVADMIDEELYRQSHQKEFEDEWMEKNRGAVMHHMESDFGPMVDDFDQQDFRMHQKDEKMAFRDPERYCADRCVATGNCDVFEDL